MSLWAGWRFSSGFESGRWWATSAGKLADAVIISQDLFKTAVNEIGKTKALVTIVGGKVVYQDSSWGMEKGTGTK